MSQRIKLAFKFHEHQKLLKIMPKQFEAFLMIWTQEALGQKTTYKTTNRSARFWELASQESGGGISVFPQFPALETACSIHRDVIRILGIL